MEETKKISKQINHKILVIMTTKNQANVIARTVGMGIMGTI